ncbi:hypothetical protein GOOTI_142_00040, partial [Gordonia otitidis NBRC 100426]
FAITERDHPIQGVVAHSRLRAAAT